MMIRQRVREGNINNKKDFGFLIIVFLVCCSFFLASCATQTTDVRYRQIVIATGSPFELGLVTELGKAFEKEYDCAVRYVKTPTGPGLDLGRNGLTHITMGHNRKATAEFVKEGYAARRIDLMHNYTVIIGPANDPAKIAGLTDLQEAHRRIKNAKAKYLSRGDGGGMHMVELKIWKDIGFNPEGKGWYEVSKTFMLQSMLNSDKNGQYHMLDSSTWAIHKSKCKSSTLLVKGPPNEYEMCLVNPEKHPNLKYNQDLAEKFYDFAISDKGQKLIQDFGVKKYGESLYYPDAKKSLK
ncbi:MAG: substrate-binding domain-containing protein [Syntrophorhabdaceae bacterium]|nr:substrate-binding domain-containing protein [Syntrophorhabdaceae bacterium]